MNYDLEERTAKFGERVICFVSTLAKNEVNKILVNQIVRSATSVGANYMEANQASSKKDFKNKSGIYPGAKPRSKCVRFLSQIFFC